MSTKPTAKIDLDRALGDWPVASPAVEEAVTAVRNRLVAATDGAPSDALFSEPFPAVDGENQENVSGSVRGVGFEGIEAPSSVRAGGKSEGSMTQQVERRRDRTSFQELAKLAQTPPPPSTVPSAGAAPDSLKSGPHSAPASNPLSWPSAPGGAGPWSAADSDSGMVDLKSIAQSDPNAVDRAQATALAKDGLFDDVPAGPAMPAPISQAPVAPGSQSPRAEAPPTSVAAALPASMAAAPAVSVVSAVPMPTPQREEKKKGGGILIGLGLVATLGAMAAGAFFYVSNAHQAEVAAAPVAVAPPPPVAQAPTPPAAPTVEAPKQEEPVAVAAPEAVDAPKGKHAAKAVAKSAGKPVAAAEAPAEAKEKAGNITGLSGSLADEMRKRVGPEDAKKNEKMEPAESTAGRQPKPSQGQVQGAIGAVLMKARECLGPDDPVSKANVVFGSSGAVQSVSVSGGAAGKPAEGCVKAALGKAKVPAFADETYSFPVTIRPL